MTLHSIHFYNIICEINLRTSPSCAINVLDCDTAVLAPVYLPKRTVKTVTIKRSQSLTVLLNVDLLSVESCAQ